MDPFAEWLKAKGFDADSLDDTMRASLQSIFDETSNPKNEPSGEKKPGEANLNAKLDLEKIRKNAIEAAAAAESYVSQVRTICAKFDNPEIEISEGEKTEKVGLLAHALSNQWSAEKVELEAMRASRPHLPAIHTSAQETSSEVLEASLCRQTIRDDKFLESQYDEKILDAAFSPKARTIGLKYLIHECIRAAGGHVHPGVGGDELIKAYEQHVLHAASGPSTISLPGILSNVANKAALQSFLAVPTTWREFCKTRNMNDFKQHTSYRLTAAGTFLEVGKDGEIKAAEVSEEMYANQLATYGRRFAFTRQDIVNDDLGMLEQIRALLGRQAALTLEEKVFTVLMDNTDNFFSTDHNNDNFSDLDIDGLTVVAQRFMDQTDADGKPIVLAADRILVPSSLAVIAQQLYSDQKVVGQSKLSNIVPDGNPHVGAYRPVPTPYLNSAGMPNSHQSRWYLFADPMNIAAMEVGFLNGVSVPTIESQQAAFEVLGTVFRGYFDFGVAKVDYRAAQRSTPTAYSGVATEKAPKAQKASKLS